MDQMVGRKEYEITVAEVDLHPTREVEANLLLNNSAAQGDFDLAKLEQLVSLPDLDIEATGWDRSDVYRMLGAEQGLGSGLSEEEAENVAESIKESTDAYNDAVKAAEVRDNEGFYMVVVFKSYAERKLFTDAMEWEDNRYQSGEDLARAVFDGEDPLADLAADGAE